MYAKANAAAAFLISNLPRRGDLTSGTKHNDQNHRAGTSDFPFEPPGSAAPVHCIR